MHENATHIRQALLVALDLTDRNDDLWQDGWAEALAAYPSDALNFVQPDYVTAGCHRLGMDTAMTAVLVQGLTLFHRLPLLKELLWYCHYVIFAQPAYTPDGIDGWPTLSAALDPQAPLFFVYVYLSGLDFITDLHRSRQIPPAITQTTLQDMALWIRHTHQTTGEWGFEQAGWLWNHFRGHLFQLGRLQFEIGHYYLTYPLFRHRHTGQVVALARDEMRFRRDGQVNGCNGITDAQAWTATLLPGADGVTGYPIHPRGMARPQPVTLIYSDWEQVLAPKDPVISVHIPATGPMDFVQCGHSFAQAIPFFQTHFAEFSPRAFLCTSWLLDYQLAEQLNPASNIARFVQEWYLLPRVGASDHQTLERVFGLDAQKPLEQLPQDTTLRRIVVAYMRSGGHWRDAGGVILVGDEGRWGQQNYQRATADQQ